MRRALVELLIPSLCPGCDAARREDAPLLCDACRRGLEPWPALGSIHTAIAYRGTGRRLVQRFKFERRATALEVLVGPLAARLAGLELAAIVPIPRHAARLRSERCDPVHRLAERLGAELRLPLLDLLERSRPTRPQSDLRPDQRRANVAGSFALPPGALAGLRVLLLDDIATTGATLLAAAAVATEIGGAARIECAALAGTPLEPALSTADPAAL